MKWGALIKETYSDTICLVDYFTEGPLGETVKNMWWRLLFEKEQWPHYYISRSVEGKPILLPRAACKDKL